MKRLLLLLLCVSSFHMFSQNAPIDFETPGMGSNWTWNVFENDDNPPLEIIANPNPGGINTSSTVAKFTARQAGQPWAGCESLHGSDIGSFALDTSNCTIKMWVYKNKISDVGIKLVDPTAAAQPEIKVANTLINQWEELTFDFSSRIGMYPLLKDQIVVFPDFDLSGRTSDEIILFDNITFSSAIPANTANLTLSVNTANIVVGPNGMYAGGGVLGDAMAVQLSDPTGSGTWTGVVTLTTGTSGNYVFLNSPAHGGDWGTKENLAGLPCADPNNWNDRILPAILADTTLLSCFGSCETDGSCSSTTTSGCTDPTANNYNASATVDDGSCMYDVTFTVDLNCESFTPGNVAATGPADVWSCGTYALSDANGDGVWDGTFSLPAGTFEYIYCADGWAQSETAGLITAMNAGGTCAPVTDYASYANRLITVGAMTTVDTWGSCTACTSTPVSGCTDSTATNYNPLATVDDGSCTYLSSALTITTTVCNGASTVAMTGPWWNWDPTAGPVAVDNGNGTWTFTFNPAPTADMEYLLVVDGVQEDLVAAGTASGDWSCTPITDYWSYANRLWVVGSGNVTNVYGTCGTCVTTISGCTDSAATNYNASATVDDGSCSYAPVLSQIDLPISWDDTTVDYTVTDFGGTVSSLSQDPLNSSNTVLMTDRTAGSQTWAGTTLSTSSGLLSAIPFVSGATTISAHVYSPASGVIVRLKAEDHTNGGISVETEATTTIANGWNTLVFDFANESNGTAAINFSNTYDMLSIFFDFGNSSNVFYSIYYLDSVYFGGAAPVANTVDLTLSVNTANISVGPNGMYAGGGVLGDAMAVQLSDPTGSGTWTGVVTLTTGTSGNYVFLNSPAHGGDWGTKENLAGLPCADPNNWNDRILPAILADTTLLSCFGSCETDGSCSSVNILAQIDLPISWDDTTVDYTVTDFGGTVSSLSQDPLNSSNTVLMTDRTAGSQTWAGTTLSTSSGLLSAIPFVSGATTISAHVYSPASGVIVRLKAEDHTNGGISVETEATTTIANGWNTLVFDFANEVNGTAAINFSNTYDMLSIFLDFGNSPSASTIYYLDSVYFGGMVSGGNGCTDPTANNYNASATVDDGSCMYDVTFTVDLNCESFTPGYVAATGPADGWSCGTYALSDANGDGVWDGTFSLPAGTFEYIYCADGWAQSETAGLIAAMNAGGTCAPVTDYASYANRLITVGAMTTVDTWGSCSACVSGIPGCTDPTAYNYNPLATISDSSCIALLYGCTDSTAINYNPSVNTDDGSCLFYGCTDPSATNYNATAVVGCDASGSTSCCTYSSGCGAITGVNMTDVIHDRATFNWNDMNSATCDVDQIRIRYSDDNGATYSTKTMGAPVGNNAPALNTSKRILNLSASTTYVYDFKIWYQDGTVVSWHAGGSFTTAAICDNVTNVTATPTSATSTDFCWDSVSTYSFVRLQYREDVPGSSFSNIGGMGVISPTLCKTKNGITPGLNYRVMWRTWCNPSGGPYRSAQWDGPVTWSQPSSIRVEGGTTINNLDVYPNPSRDIFNVSFTSEDVQDLDVRIINVIGEVVYTENLNKFVGEYTKQVDLANYTKGIYFLEITTDNGVINKKLILQ